jgi:hypothetical protein
MIHVISNPISPDFPAKMPMLWENLIEAAVWERTA